jgi:hypothetical protein
VARPVFVKTCQRIGAGRQKGIRQNWFSKFFVTLKILDRNLQISFDKTMSTKAKAKSTVHDGVHALRPNTC